MREKVDHHTKKARTRVLIEQGARKKRAFYEQYIGSSCEVLFEQKMENGNWVGYTPNYMNIEVKSTHNIHNQILPVKLKGSNGRALIGELVTQDR